MMKNYRVCRQKLLPLPRRTYNDCSAAENTCQFLLSSLTPLLPEIRTPRNESHMPEPPMLHTPKLLTVNQATTNTYSCNDPKCRIAQTEHNFDSFTNCSLFSKGPPC